MSQPTDDIAAHYAEMGASAAVASSAVASSAVAGRRPRDRREHILHIAAKRFAADGFAQVSMADIAAEVGISAGAIYRHFPSKQAMLATATLRGLHAARDAARAAPATDAEPDTVLDATLRALAIDALAHRHVGLLVNREVVHLPPAAQAAVLGGLHEVTDRVAASLGRADAAAGTSAKIVAWCALQALWSCSWHHTSDPPTGAAELLVDIGRAVVTADVADAVESGCDPTQGAEASVAGLDIEWAHARRAATLRAATAAFATGGYAATTMETIGEAAGLSGPAIYHHFSGKAELLAAVLTRGAEWLQLGLERALARGHSPQDQLRGVLRSYVEFLVEQRALMRVFLDDTVNLSGAERADLRRVQRGYVGQWVDLLVLARGGMDPTEARWRIHAALAVANSGTRQGWSDAGVDVIEVVDRIGQCVLGLEGTATTPPSWRQP